MNSEKYSTINEQSHKKFRIAHNSEIGRHLVASQEIKSGDIIIDEPVIVRGPCVDFRIENDRDGRKYSKLRKRPCCVCFKSFDLCNISCNRCDCKLFCSVECSFSNTHTTLECKIMQSVRDLTKILDLVSYCNLITVIRCLFVRRENRIQWLQICNLESKVKELETIHAFDKFTNIFEGLTWKSFGVDEDEPMAANQSINTSLPLAAKHCYGVMRMNAYSYLNQSVGFEGLYFFTALMSHSCIMNTDRQFDIQDGRMIVKAARVIQRGEIITTTYLSLMNNTQQRHHDMSYNWFFICKCRRCQDPTELHTFMSTVLLEQINDHQDDSGSYIDSDSLAIITNSLPEDFDDPEPLENWLDRFDNGIYLHPNHSLFSEVKLYLCLYYGRQAEGIQGLSNKILLRKFHLCCQILGIFDIIYPGIYQCKGELLFELWNTVRLLNVRGIEYEKSECISQEKLAHLAYDILYHSLQTSPYHYMKEILEEEYPELTTKYPKVK